MRFEPQLWHVEGEVVRNAAGVPVSTLTAGDCERLGMEPSGVNGWWVTRQAECCQVPRDAFTNDGTSGDFYYYGPYGNLDVVLTVFPALEEQVQLASAVAK